MGLPAGDADRTFESTPHVDPGQMLPVLSRCIHVFIGDPAGSSLSRRLCDGRGGLSHESSLDFGDALRPGSGAGEPATLEGKIVRLVDRIAYINHDIDDALRAGVLASEDLPEREIAILGPTGPARIDTLVHDLVAHSEAAGDIAQGEEVGRAMYALRSFMFERVYLGPAQREQAKRVERVLRGLFDWYCEHPDELPPGEMPDRVIDYLAGMTDRFAIGAWTERFVPQGLAL